MKVLIVLVSTVVCLAFGLTETEINALLDAHNNFRSELANGKTVLNKNGYAQPAKNMYKLSYNASIEALAQEWTDRCVWNHSRRVGFGENLFGFSGKLEKADALKSASGSWWSEFNSFEALLYKDGNAYYNEKKEVKMNILHATQMGWARTTQVGCGVSYCPSIGTFLVCNYAEQGNFGGEPVYEVGNACASNDQCTTFPNSKCEVPSGLCVVATENPVTSATQPANPTQGTSPTENPGTPSDAPTIVTLPTENPVTPSVEPTLETRPTPPVDPTAPTLPVGPTSQTPGTPFHFWNLTTTFETEPPASTSGDQTSETATFDPVSETSPWNFPTGEPTFGPDPETTTSEPEPVIVTFASLKQRLGF